MSYLRTIIDFIQTLSLKDEEINNLLKEIDEMNRENTTLEYQLEELEREHVRLQIEYHNLKTISSFKDVSAIENLRPTFQKIYKNYVELKSLIDNVDFTKILQCNYMEMEAKCRKEWQPIEDSIVKTLNWHQKMEQRHIVQRYRQAEITHREVENANKTQQNSMEESLKQSVELINQANDRRNNIIINLIKGRQELAEYRKKMVKLNQYEVYINGLRQEKLEIRNQLEQTHFKTFNPKLNSNTSHNFALTTTTNKETTNFIMPKFPSFSDILESFNQAEKVANITAIQNCSNFCVKSILHTSNTSITTKQTKNVHFKVQLEEYQEETTEIETDVDQMSPKTTMEINESQGNCENLQEINDLENNSDIETIDLLTPADNKEKVVKELKETIDHEVNTKQIGNKSMIDIQDCIIFKTPFPIEELKCIENISDKSNVYHSKPSTDRCSTTSPPQDITEILNTTKSSFYEEFSKLSSPEEASPEKTADFETFFNENKDSVIFSKDSTNEERQINAVTNNISKNNSSEIQDFLDFGSNKGFTFDSDDNMGTSYNTGNMDFM